MSQKPLLWSEDASDLDRYDPRKHQGLADPGRIPGYSEIVRANDIAKADDLTFRNQNPGRTKEDVYRQIGAHPAPLPVEFAWLRISDPGGQNSSTAARDLDGYMHQRGFRLATEEDLTGNGYGWPPQARKAEDGTIRRGPDTALYVRSGEVARVWESFKVEQAAADKGELGTEFSDGGYVAPTFSDPEERTQEVIRH